MKTTIKTKEGIGQRGVTGGGIIKDAPKFSFHAIPLCFAWHIFAFTRVTPTVHGLTQEWDPLRPTGTTRDARPRTLQAPRTHTTCPRFLPRPCIVNTNQNMSGNLFGKKPGGAGYVCVEI